MYWLNRSMLQCIIILCVFCSRYSIKKNMHMYNNTMCSFIVLFTVFFFLTFSAITESIFIILRIMKFSTVFNFLVDCENYWSFITLPQKPRDRDKPLRQGVLLGCTILTNNWQISFLYAYVLGLEFLILMHSH